MHHSLPQRSQGLDGTWKRNQKTLDTWNIFELQTARKEIMVASVCLSIKDESYWWLYINVCRLCVNSPTPHSRLRLLGRR